MELKPLTYKQHYEKAIATKIVIWLWSNLFKECLIILNKNTVTNDSNIIIEALNNGSIYYQNNAFYSTTGKFNNALSKELEKIGAKYSQYRKAYLLDKSKLSLEILSAIDILKAETANKVLALQTFLNFKLSELSKKEKQIVFDDLVEKIMFNLQDRVYQNAKDKKIELISPKLTDFRANEIAKNYTNNLDYWIKNWTEETIVRMRDRVGQMALEGKSRQDIAEYISKEFGISQRHSVFLARNETAIATSSYLQAKYREEGFSQFRWVTNIDGRERPLHKQLNKQIFRFDNPPIIDERTGQKGLPGETYNCRCSMAPIIDKDFFKRRHELFKANNSFINRLQNAFRQKEI